MSVFCTSCGTQLADVAAACPHCSQAISVGGGAAAAPATIIIQKPFLSPLQCMRYTGFALDGLVIILLAVILAVPILGAMMYGALVLVYHLLRDVIGGTGSMGKRGVGLKVLKKDGSEATTGQKVLRNITFAAPYIFFMIPLFGPLIALPFLILAFLLESIMVAVKGERLGDMIAGTAVVLAS